MVGVILREQLSTIANFKAQLQDIDYVEKAVRHRHKELTSTMTEIKLQRSLIRDEMDSGAMYGDERKADHERPGPGPLGDDDINEKELEELMNRELEPAEVPAPKPQTVTPAPATNASPAEADEAAIRTFLDAGTRAKPAEDDDFSEVLSRI
jgi:hypothetical protein